MFFYGEFISFDFSAAIELLLDVCFDLFFLSPFSTVVASFKREFRFATIERELKPKQIKKKMPSNYVHCWLLLWKEMMANHGFKRFKDIVNNNNN